MLQEPKVPEELRRSTVEVPMFVLLLATFGVGGACRPGAKLVDLPESMYTTGRVHHLMHLTLLRTRIVGGCAAQPTKGHCDV